VVITRTNYFNKNNNNNDDNGDDDDDNNNNTTMTTNLHFAHRVYLCTSYDVNNKQQLQYFPTLH